MLNYAIYAETLNDYLKRFPTVLSDNIVMSTEEKSSKLIEMIKAKYYNYEVGGETPKEFELFIKNVFSEYKDYYEELIEAYETQITWLDGIKDTEDYTNTSEGVSKQNALPNRVVTDPTKYLTEQDTQNNTSKTTRTRKGGKTQAELKVEYMKQIRNIYNEFAERFGVCFISLLD